MWKWRSAGTAIVSVATDFANGSSAARELRIR